MHTITVLQYWHITLTTVSVVCVVFGHSRGRKQKKTQENYIITYGHYVIWCCQWHS